MFRWWELLQQDSRVLAVENVEGYFPIPSEFMPNAQSFMLKVKGDSMINAGIFDGDQVLVKQQSSAKTAIWL